MSDLSRLFICIEAATEHAAIAGEAMARGDNSAAAVSLDRAILWYNSAIETVALCDDDGGVTKALLEKRRQAARVAWQYVTGA